MTKKHYIMIAGIMSEFSRTGEPIVKSLAHAFADQLAGDNPRFDRSRFLLACGYDRDEQWPVR